MRQNLLILCFQFQRPPERTRIQAVARIVDRITLQHLWGSRDVIGHVTI